MQQMNETDEGKERREHGAGMSFDGAGTDGAGRSDERRCRAAYRAQAKEMKRRIYPNGIDILAMIGIILVSSLAAGLVGGALTWLTEWNTGLVNALTYFLQMGLAITFILVQRRTRQAPTNVLNMHAGRISAPLILWGIVLIFVTGVVIEPLLELFPDKYLEQLNQYIGTGGWSILMTVVLAPVMEETLFRGLIQGSINERDGAAKAILLSALLFGVFHMIPQQAINAFLVGIILGYIYFRTKSLLTVIILHALNNGISYLMLEVLGPSVPIWPCGTCSEAVRSTMQFMGRVSCCSSWGPSPLCAGCRCGKRPERSRKLPVIGRSRNNIRPAVTLNRKRLRPLVFLSRGRWLEKGYYRW